MGGNFQWNIKTTEVSANCGTSFLLQKACLLAGLKLGKKVNKVSDILDV